MEIREFEYESRAMLTLSQYTNILSYFFNTFYNNHKKSFIENEYYDTDSLDIFNNKFMLRVRLNEDSFDLTLKIPLEEEKGDLEIHQFLNEGEYLNLKNNSVFPNGQIKEEVIQNNINISKIRYQTTLYCVRYEFLIDECTIVLDKNKYGRITDYNIEIESDSYLKSQEKNLELSKTFKYLLKENYQTKYIRALTNKD